MQLRQRPYQVLGTAWAAWFVNYIDRTKTAALLPLISSSLAMTTAQTGSVLFAFFVGYAVVQPFAGLLTYAVGPKKSLAVSVASFSVFTLAMAVVGSWEELFVRNLLFGIGQGLEVTAGFQLVVNWFPAGTRGRASALYQNASTVAPILAPFIVVPIAEATGSWRWSFIAVAFLGLPMLALIFRFVADRPQDPPQVSHVSPDHLVLSYRDMVLNRSVGLLLAAGFFCSLAIWGLTTWLPTYGVQQLKLPLIVAGSLSSSLYAGILCGVVVGGYVSDRVFDTKRTPIWLFGGLVMATTVLWATTFEPGVPLVEIYAVFFFAGLASSMTPVGQLSAPYVAELLSPTAVGRTLGVVILGGMLGSAIAQPLVATLIIDTPAGPQFWPVFVVFAACGVITSACVTLMVEPRVRRTYIGYLVSGRREGPWPASPVQA